MERMLTMNVKMNLDGLHKLQRRAKELDGTHQVPVAELLTGEFMRRHTKFGSLDAMIEASPFTVESAEDFRAIPDAEWDAFVRQQTRFSSWREMLSSAGAEWMKKQLFK
jgi:hypothetical protein